MSTRKLRVVEYDRDFIDYEDENEIRRFVATIEEIYHIARRAENWPAELLDQKNVDICRTELDAYFRDVGAPEAASRPVQIDYVLNSAIQKIYENNEAAQSLTFSELKRKTEQLLEAQKDSHNPLNRIDYNDPKFAENARTICSLLGISNSHPDAKVVFRAACLYICENLNDSVLDAENQSEFVAPEKIPLKDIPLGIATPKLGCVNHAARILRLISLRQLQEVQKRINETLVQIQSLTMDMSKKPNNSQVQYGRK